MKSINFFAKSSKPKDSKSEVEDEWEMDGFRDKQESMEFDTLEFHEIYKSTDEESKIGELGSHKLSTFEEGSWQLLVVNPKEKEETEVTKPFTEVLSFWKQKEKGET